MSQPVDRDRPGLVGWVLVGVTAVVLVVTVVVTVNLISRDTLEPIPVATVTSL